MAISLQDSWRSALRRVGARADSAAWLHIDELPAHPALDAQAAQTIAGRTWPAASEALERLALAGVLKRRDSRKRGRSREGPQLFDEIKAFEASVHADGEIVDET
jgi:hypothetical protein